MPFKKVIDVTSLTEYHRVIPMETFLEFMGPEIWKANQRYIFCYSKRPGLLEDDCNPLEGNPFGSFWRQLNISGFSKSIFHAPLTTNFHQADDWIIRFSKYPVITFVGAPSSFPTNPDAIKLQKYVKLSPELITSGNEYRKSRGFGSESYVGVHLRHGTDWDKACGLLKENSLKELFSSKQCSDGTQYLPYDVCLPDLRQVSQKIISSLLKFNMTTVYVATDFDDDELWPKLYDYLKSSINHVKLITPSGTYSQKDKVNDLKIKPPTVLIDISILSSSDVFIGNCISSFSGFISRLRNLSFLIPKDKTIFFGQESLIATHDEL